MRLALLLVLCFAIPFTLFAESPRAAAQKGLEYYNSEEYDKALAEFLAGLEKNPENSELKYDVGTALYKLQDFENATGAFSQALDEDDKEFASQAWYNLGNALLNNGKMKEAVGAYKNSLRLKHDDEDTKFNLETALRMMQMQQQQQQQNQESKQDSTQQDSTSQQQQQAQAQPDSTQQDSTQQQKEQEQQEMAQQDSTQQQPQPKENKDEMSEEEAMQLLQAMETDEQEALKEKLRRQFGEPKRAEKDW